MPIDIRGKQYVTVAERVLAVHSDKENKEVSITTEVVLHDPVLFKATVVTQKGTFTGYSAANPSKTIEAQSPYEVAETSAIGRALGFAGYGVVEGIATADEMNKGGYETSHQTKQAVQPSNLTAKCSFHGVDMRSAISKRTGNEFWSHKVGDEFCFGKGTKSEQEALG